MVKNEAYVSPKKISKKRLDFAYETFHGSGCEKYEVVEPLL